MSEPSNLLKVDDSEFELRVMSGARIPREYLGTYSSRAVAEIQGWIFADLLQINTGPRKSSKESTNDRR